MYCSDLALLLQKYANAQTKEEIYIKRTLEGIAELFEVCDKAEYYYADMITRNFCRVIDMLEKQREKETAALEASGRTAERLAQFLGNRDGAPAARYSWHQDLMCAFYNHFKEQGQVDYLEVPAALAAGRKDLVNPTMKDYVARIYTFAGPKYLGQMFPRESFGDKHPVLFTYENIELILATFKTRDENGQIVKQRVNIRSALRKLNEFKQQTQG